MNNFGPIRTKAYFTPSFYYKNYNNETYINMLAIYDDKEAGRRIEHSLLHAFTLLMDLKRSKKTVRYITKIRNKSPHIPYYRQRFWPWNIFKWLCVTPFLRSGLCDGRSASTSLEHSRTDITQHMLLTLCDQRAAHVNTPPHHLANTDCQRRVAVVPIYARLYKFIFLSRNSDS